MDHQHIFQIGDIIESKDLTTPDNAGRYPNYMLITELCPDRPRFNAGYFCIALDKPTAREYNWVFVERYYRKVA